MSYSSQPIAVAGKYRLTRHLGSGGMADVWAATHELTGREVALKRLLPAAGAAGDARARFLVESRAASRVDHPHVVEVLDAGWAEDGSPYLVMERLRGPTLDVALARGMSLREFVGVMTDVACALAAAHGAGVLHCDLKPQNLVLHVRGNGARHVKVVDFGVAQLGKDSRTGAGCVFGSPQYMSPEQARGERELDARTDVFAFGSILFEGLVGYRPYDGRSRSLHALLVTIATQPPLDIRTCAHPAVPPRLLDLVARCLAHERSARVRSFEEVTDLLLEIAATLPDARLPRPSAPPAAQEPAPPRSAPHPWRLALAMVGALSTLGSGLCVAGGIAAWRTFHDALPAEVTAATVTAPRPAPAPFGRPGLRRVARR